MLTVKHIAICGTERLIEAKTVVFRPKDARKDESVPTPHADALEIYRADGDETLFGGTIFVMNEYGKTVSRYDLGPSSVPLNPSIDAQTATRAIRQNA